MKHWVQISPFFIVQREISRKDFKELYEKAVPHRPRWALRETGKRIRLYKKKKVVLPHIYRMSIVINAPLTKKGDKVEFKKNIAIESRKGHRRYYGFLYQEWHKLEKDFSKVVDENKLIRKIEEWLGSLYGRRSYKIWFDYVIGVEEPTEVAAEESLIDTWLFVVENKTGKVEHYEKGNIEAKHA